MGFEPTDSDWNVEEPNLVNAALSADAEAGAGGGDMEIHSESRESRLRTLVQATYDDLSNFPLSSGFVDTESTDWNERFETGEQSNTALPAAAEDGENAGGFGVMDIFNQSREVILRNLVQGDFEDQTSFTLSAAFVDTESTQWNVRFETGEQPNTSPSSGAEIGDNDGNFGDMEIFSESRNSILRSLVQEDYTNLSRFTLSAGIIDTETTDWEARFESGEQGNMSLTTEAENGSGGGDMTVWDAGRQAQLRRLVQADYINNSIFNVPSGFADTESTEWSERFEQGEQEHTDQESEVESGTGGGNMAVFSKARLVQLRNLITTTFDNQSQFGLPSGFVDASDTDWQERIETGEKGHGFTITGAFATASADPLPGVAKIFEDDNLVSEKSISGAFIVNAPPRSGVITGEEGGSSVNSFRFEPDIDALQFTIDNLNVDQDIGRVQYGEATGVVRDFNGNPVEGEPVSGPGVAAKTNASGEYSLQGPGGTAVTLTSLNDAFSKDVLLTGGQTEEINWQFAGVRGTIKLPSGISIQGTTVTTSRDTPSLKTGPDGRVLFKEFPPNVAATMTFGDAITVDFTSNGEGQLVSKTVRVGAGFQGKVVNALDKEPVLDIDVQIDGANTTFKSFSTSTGRFFVGTEDTGDLTLVLGRADRRFEEFTLSQNLTEGDVKKRDIELQPQTVIGSFG